MNSAPSVTYPVRSSTRARLLLIVLWVLGAAGVIAWCFQADSVGVRQIVAISALFLAALLVGRAISREPHGNLHWDGQYWSLDGTRPVNAAQATVHLDFQSLVLLRLKVDRSVSWLWLDRRAGPAHWRAVRRALFAHRTSADSVTVDAEQPAVKHPVISVS